MSNHILDHIVYATKDTIDFDDILGLITKKTKNLTSFECIGIRVEDGEDYTYRNTVGFPQSFIDKENSLLSRNEDGDILCDSDGKAFLECMCGNVISRRFDPSLPFFTKRGSFWTNSTTEFFATTTEKERQARTKNYCNTVGYESVGIFALGTPKKNIGVLHVTDSRTGLFTDRNIQTFESIADYLTGLVNRFLSVVSKLEREKKELQEEMKSIKQMNACMVGREKRITEFKDEIKRLKERHKE